MKQPLRPPAIIAQAPVVFVRCHCPTCRWLDGTYPGEGYQLGFWPYVPQLTTAKRRVAVG
jgi:hypothetical protein